MLTESLLSSNTLRMSSVRRVSSPSRGTNAIMALSICSGRRTLSCNLGWEWTAYYEAISLRFVESCFSTHPVAGETALLNHYLPSFFRGLIEAGKKVVHVARESWCVRNFLFSSSDEFRKMRSKGFIYMFPWPLIGMIEMTSHRADPSYISLTSAWRHESVETHLVDQTSSSSIICCLAFLLSRPRELPQK